MDINEILNSLGIDLTNPEAKRGAIEAIQAILDSRTPPPDIGGGAGGMVPPGKEIDVDIDPDLLQPSQKFNQPNSNDDIEIEDEEDVLSQVKHNESEDDFDNDKNSTGKDSSESDSDDSSGANTSDSDSTGANGGSDDTTNSDSGADENSNDIDSGDAESTGKAADDDNDNDSAEERNGSEDEGGSGESEDNDSYEGQEEGSEADDIEADTEDSDGEEAEDDENEDDFDEDELEDGEPKEEDEFDFDEDELLDDEIKNSYDDQEIKSKHEARKLKRARTLAAAKAALEKAKEKKVAPALIKELEKSIEALESLTEAKAKSIADMSDEEFNLVINRVFDAISAVGDNDLTFTSDEERELRAQEIKADLGSRETQQELSDEDIAALRAETQAVKAREKEIQRFRQPAPSSFKGFKEFLNSLYRAIALQVQTNEIQDDTWSAINKRYNNTGVLKQGQRKNELPDREIPVIDFYFDQSGSWSKDDIKVGEKAVQSLADMEANGQIKINVYYFSDDVFTDAASARAMGGTYGWNEIVKNIIATQATNVIIMTDSDMEHWWNGPVALKYTVPGYVWYLWKDGKNAPRLPRDLKGRGGVQQFSFNLGDI